MSTPLSEGFPIYNLHRIIPLKFFLYITFPQELCNKPLMLITVIPLTFTPLSKTGYNESNNNLLSPVIPPCYPSAVLLRVVFVTGCHAETSCASDRWDLALASLYPRFSKQIRILLSQPGPLSWFTCVEVQLNTRRLIPSPILRWKSEGPFER